MTSNISRFVCRRLDKLYGRTRDPDVTEATVSKIIVRQRQRHIAPFGMPGPRYDLGQAPAFPGYDAGRKSIMNSLPP